MITAIQHIFFEKVKTNQMNNTSINIDEGKFQIGIKTYIMQFIATVSITITGCSIYYGIIISDLKNQLNTVQLEKNQIIISKRMDSTGSARNIQIEQLIRDNQLMKAKLGIKDDQ